MKQKTVILGLDGATWKLLKPLMDAGSMPNMERLVKRGVHGPLESTRPAMTAPAWTSFATGKHPGAHGIFDFMLPTNTLENMKFADSSDIQDKTFYELLDEHGYQSILVNLPVSFPPKLKNTITITSLLTQGEQWIFPEGLKSEYAGFDNYRLTPDESLRLKERKDQYIEDLLVHMDEQLDCVQWLYENKPWDVFFYLFSHSDWVSHLDYEGLIERQDPNAVRIFKRIDEYLGWFADRLPEDANLVILSDHGFKLYKKVFFFNKWLEKEGYLTTNTASDSFRGAATRRAKETDKIRGTKKRINLGSGVFKTLARFPTLERAAKWTYHHIVKPYLPVNIQVNVGIDFEQTTVCFPKGSYITNAYINKDWVYDNGCVSKDDYLALRTEVVDKMKAIRDPQGNPVVRDVLTREDVYGDQAPDEAPDIFFELADYWLIGQFHSDSLFAEEIHNKHDTDGIILGVGPAFAQDATVEGMKISDVLPTLFHALGLPVPSDCTGTAQSGMYAPGTPAATSEPVAGPPSSRRKKPTTEKKAISSAIRSLKL